MLDLNSSIFKAEDFKYKEFIKSDVAIRYGFDNMPNNSKLINIERLAVNVLQPLRNEFGGIKITSGFRCKQLNYIIGGSPTSNHLLGEAADIEPVENNVKLIDLVKFIYNNLDFRTIILEYPKENGWVHVDYREGGNIKMLKLKDRYHDYVKVTFSDLLNSYLED